MDYIFFYERSYGYGIDNVAVVCNKISCHRSWKKKMLSASVNLQKQMAENKSVDTDVEE